MQTLRVGIIGASAARGWASVSHVPAVKALAGLELVAVASGDQKKADAATAAFGIARGYANGFDLIRDPDVDLVTIAVKVPDHHDLFLAAAAAGKHIYCEWPLGRNLAETEELAMAARKAGIHVAVGLQTRANPAAMQARSLIASKAIGRILSARVLSTTAAFGSSVEPAMAFAEVPENGVTLPTIQGAHTLDLTIALLGAYSELGALTSTQYPDVEIGDRAEHARRTTPDHMLVQTRLQDGGVLSIEVAGGRPATDVTFAMTVVGDTGDLTLEGGAPRGFQSGKLTLSLNGVQQSVNEGELTPMPDEAQNVAGLYAALRDDINDSTERAPGADHAVRLTRLLDDVMDSSQTGSRKRASEWPEC